MSLWCFGAYLAAAVIFSLLYWMALIVARRHDEEKGYLPPNDALYSGD